MLIGNGVLADRVHVQTGLVREGRSPFLESGIVDPRFVDDVITQARTAEAEGFATAWFAHILGIDRSTLYRRMRQTASNGA